MAVQTWEDIVANAPLSADERKLLDNVIGKAPALKEGWLRQDDYSRRQNELKAEQEKMKTRLEYADKMEAWSEDGPKKWMEAGIIDEDYEPVWQDAKAKLEADLKAAQAAAVGGEMDPVELDKIVRKIVTDLGGQATKEEVAALYKSEGEKMAQGVFDKNWAERETTFNEKTIPFVTGFSTASAIVAGRWERETGQKWGEDQQKQMFELMSTKKDFNPYHIEEDLLKPHIEKKSREADIEAEVQKRLASRRGMPGGGGEDFIPQGDGVPQGALQRALAESKNEGDFEQVIKSRAVEAAKALHAEGK